MEKVLSSYIENRTTIRGRRPSSVKIGRIRDKVRIKKEVRGEAQPPEFQC